jgi:hypothetical protein
MLDLTRAPDCEQPPFLRVLRLGAACPKRIINSIDLDDARIGQWFIVSLGFAEAFEQFRPTVMTRMMRADSVQCGCDRH